MATQLITYDPAKRASAPFVVQEGEGTTGFTIMVEFKEQDDVTYEVPITALLKAGESGFEFKLEPTEEGHDLGTLGGFYNSAADMLPIPKIDLSTLPSPIKEILGTMVTIMVFEVNTSTGMLRLDVKFTPQPPITLPIFDKISIKYAEFMMDRPGTPPPPPPLRA
jgi:hypothetical protein